MPPFSLHILLYHDVAASDAEGLSRTCPRYTTAAPRLKAHLDIIRESGCATTRMEEWLQWKQTNQFPPGRHVLMTFDGPHVGWFDHAIPLLREYDMPATFFVTAGWVGANHRYPESRHLTWKEVSSIPAYQSKRGICLFDLGNHSMWHSVLVRQVNEQDADFTARLHEEMVVASQLIHSKTGHKPLSFATPKGEGSIDELAPFLRQANLQAVRWAHWPGRALSASHDPFDLQIAYCDMTDLTLSSTQTLDPFKCSSSPSNPEPSFT